MSEPSALEGLDVPLHRSLVDPILVGGLPRSLAYLLWTGASAFVFGLHQGWMLPMAMGLHVLFATVARSDPYFFDVFVRAIRAQRRLDP